MLGKEFEELLIEDMYQGICGCEDSLSDSVAMLCEKDEILKRSLSFYELLVLVMFGKSISSELRRINREQEVEIIDALEAIDVDYDVFAVDSDDALEEFGRVASTQEGYDALRDVCADIEEFHLYANTQVDRLSLLQNALAEIAFLAERIRNDVDDPCVGSFLKRMREQDIEPWRFGDILDWCEVCERAQEKNCHSLRPFGN